MSIEAPLDLVARCLPPALGRLEPVDEHSCRLTGSTSDPHWYAEQLARTPGLYRVVGGPEVQQAVRRLGEKMLAAVDPE